MSKLPKVSDVSFVRQFATYLVCDLYRVCINAQYHLMSARLVAECIIPSSGFGAIKCRIEEDCKGVGIHVLVPGTTFAVLVVFVAVTALALFLILITIIGLDPSETVARLCISRIPKLLSPDLERNVDFAAVQVVSVYFGGVTVLDNPKSLITHSHQRPWLRQAGFESAGTSVLHLLSNNIMDHDSVRGYVAQSSGGSKGPQNERPK